MKNKLTDLNNHLFEQLERLNNDELTGDELKNEISRAKAMADVGQQIINSANTSLDAMKLLARGEVRREDLPLLIEQK